MYGECIRILKCFTIIDLCWLPVILKNTGEFRVSDLTFPCQFCTYIISRAPKGFARLLEWPRMTFGVYLCVRLCVCVCVCPRPYHPLILSIFL